MDSQGIHVMTIANSIIGVSIIAMPFCFKQCGILLSIFMLVISSIISRLSCHFLLKSAIRARLRTFEFLAYHAFGPFGKFFVEIGMIGFLIGTCIAFFVVMGDLGPQIVAQMIGIKNSDALRSGILVGLAFFCVLPLGLLRNVDSLSGVCIATIGFYGCLVLKIMAESASHIVTGDWYDKVDLWRAEGVLQCIPIFSMALFCQTQLFEIYQAIPNASLEKMNALIRTAVNICTCVYIFVGVFGYIAVSDQIFAGNILLNLKPSFLTEIIKIGFVLSLAFSFPLIIFPCRASLFSMIYKPSYSTLHDGGTNFIPETKFRTLTVFIILVSLIIGILIPNIELVLGLVGSTIGVSICVLFPATCFICMVKKNTNERILAQIMLFIGIIVMVLGTYANLNAVDGMTSNTLILVSPKMETPVVQQVHEKNVVDIPTTVVMDIPSVKIESIENKNLILKDNIKESRHEPPQPIEPVERPKEIQAVPVLPVQSEIPPKEPEFKEVRREPPQPIEPEHNINQIKEESQVNQPNNGSDKKSLNVNIPNEDANLKKHQEKIAIENLVGEQIDAEAIKKEEKEMNQEAQEDLRNVVKKLDALSELQMQNQAQQKQIVEQQQKILDEMKQRKDIANEPMEMDKLNQDKLKAAKEIQDIAKKAIESLDSETILESNVAPNKKEKNIQDIAKEAIKNVMESDSKANLESNIIPNQEGNLKLTNLNANSNTSVVNKVKANPAPLSYQLGLNVANETKNDEKVSPETFIPLPIIKSNSIINSNNPNISVGKNDTNTVDTKNSKFERKNNKNNSNVVKNETNGKNIQRLNITGVEKGKNLTISKEIGNSDKDKSDLQEIKSMRRDILSEDENKDRNKRDVPDSNEQSVHCEQNISDKEKDHKVNMFVENLKLPKYSDNSEDKDENCDKS